MQVKKEDNIVGWLNRPGTGIVSFLNMQKKCFDSMEEGGALKKLVVEGQAIILPYEEQLYPYGESVSDYLDDREILVPNGMSVKAYLLQSDRDMDFREFRAEELEKRFVAWSEKQGVQIV